MLSWVTYDMAQAEHKERIRQAELARRPEGSAKPQSLTLALRSLLARFGSF